MRTSFAALAAATLLLVAVAIRPRPTGVAPAPPVATVELRLPTVATTSTTVDWRPYVAGVVAARARESAASRAAVQEALRAFDVTRWPDWPLWRCTALHEAGSVDWTNVAHNQSGTFAGPFDISRAAWTQHAPPWIVRLFPLEERAPPWVQVIGARAVRARVGSSLWGGLRRCEH